MKYDFLLVCRQLKRITYTFIDVSLVALANVRKQKVLKFKRKNETEKRKLNT